ncbi:porphobilinogen synthase [Kyrpidia spormannii]|uniref:Delta-aminolevulinic acid dehydratase n=1 Tax=Kyrpidia spormannii TaxID=2055160 RepID=A0A2K8N6A4_9BACL|nr:MULTISPECIES: porphobilinogen synthase [Kyrpidia]ATY84337.1 porphobilinogen synthase [Kyrpidia spormannii]MCL6575608.1 porphobilinogen synthase [Kyrpidia sp.]
MQFDRHRRLRWTPGMRDLWRENRLSIETLMYPLFAVHGSGVREPISSMPGVEHLSVDELRREAVELAELGVRSILLFGIPAHKDERSSEAYDERGIVQQAIRAVKEEVPEMVVATDVCLCQYNPAGHCGIVRNGVILNDETLPLLAQTALSHAAAGADLVAPSDMMDGRVKMIRSALDERGFEHVPVMSYAVKYASAFYGPFREAADSAPQFGDRRSHQMDPANRREAIREARSDLDEGADVIMVKPAMAYMDIIRDLRERFDVPVAAYQVSGEYSMIKAAGLRGWIDERAVVLESLLGLRRAGADLIITYFAKDVARWLREDRG